MNESDRSSVTDVRTFQRLHLVGIKGVAMTSLAQVLLDLGVRVTGSDVAESFVTQPLLDTLRLDVQDLFDSPLPESTQAVVYTAAHGAAKNPQVKAALDRGLPVMSHAQALAGLFNHQRGVAVCGVGGKSTVSAMITWVLTQLKVPCSFSVGVGDIIGLGKTGQWREGAAAFIAEADEYVTEPNTSGDPDRFQPRFWLLSPQHIVCNRIAFDHPDVYRDLDHTLDSFGRFFTNLKAEGSLIVHSSNRPHWQGLGAALPDDTGGNSTTWFGSNQADDYRLLSSTSANRQTEAKLLLPTPTSLLASGEKGRISSTLPPTHHNHQPTELKLRLPGSFNSENALAAIAACDQLGLPRAEVLAALETFRSTKRRFEYIGTKQGVAYYDDYAHHPHQIAATIEAMQSWLADKKIAVAFQPHTYSRTRALFDSFVEALGRANHLLLLDIFASAREELQPDVSSSRLAAAFKKAHPASRVEYLPSIDDLATYCRSELTPQHALITMGAGDIYQLHQVL